MAEKLIVEYTHDRQVVRITLNAPKGNVLDAAMMAELQGELDKLKDEPQVKMLQFTGAGDHFSFGASVPEHTRDKAPQMLKQFHSLFYSIIDLGIPTAALVSGQCLGGGMELALICNLLFADETARLSQPEISLAVFPPPASLILPLKIGQARADDLLISGQSITAADALASGLACAVYPSRAVMLEKVDKWVQKHILSKSASSLRFAVKAARQSFNAALIDGLKKLEQMYLTELMATHDANEGIASFLERRPPVWTNN